MKKLHTAIFKQTLLLKALVFGILLLYILPPVPSPAESRKLDLDTICKSLTSHKVTSGSFVQKRSIASIKRELSSNGTFIICNEGISWKTARPISSVLSVTDEKIIQISPDGKKNVMDGSGNPTFKNIAQTLSSLFSGNRDALESNFHVSFSSSDSFWKITLVPKDSNISAIMANIVMSGNAAEETSLDTLEIAEQGGGKITYLFSEQTYKDSLNDDEKKYFSAD